MIKELHVTCYINILQFHIFLKKIGVFISVWRDDVMIELPSLLLATCHVLTSLKIRESNKQQQSTDSWISFSFLTIELEIRYFTGSRSVECGELGNIDAFGSCDSKVLKGVQVSWSSLVLLARCLPNFCLHCWCFRMGNGYQTWQGFCRNHARRS